MVTNGAWTNFEYRPLVVISKVYFSDLQDITEFVTYFKEHTLYNHVPDKKRNVS